MNYKIIIGEERISELQKTLGANAWPEFMQHDCIVNKYWSDLYTDFLNFQFALFDGQEIVGIGNTIHLNWQGLFAELPDSGLDWAMNKANIDFKSGLKSNLLIAVQILINPKYQSHGISYEMLDIMKDIARTNEIDNIALPVRPTLKCNYPLIKIDDYISWKNKEGLAFDPWIRVHLKAGGKIVGICNKSMYITGTVAEWEKWTGMLFPGSGDYIVDKALTPITIDKKKDIGTYIEPNVWIVYVLK
jgi:hypothetical protein